MRGTLTKMFRNTLVLLSIIFCGCCIYAKRPSTITCNDSDIYLALDWNKQTPDLSKRIFETIRKSSADSTTLFLYFYETNLTDIYGNKFDFVGDTIKLMSLNNDNVRRFKDVRYFSNQFSISDSIALIRDRIHQGVDIDVISTLAEEEVSSITLSKEEIINKIILLEREHNIIYSTNPFNPLDNSCADNELIEIPDYSNSLYYISRTKKSLMELCKWRAILHIKYPNHNEPELADDLDE